LSTGIEEILIEKLDYDEFIGKDDIKADIADNTFLRKLKENPASMLVVRNAKTKEDVSLVYENDNIIVKRLVTHHTGILGEKTAFNIYEESDGTKRLIDFIPAFQGIIHEKKVFIIDEIEHSLHPILIKELLKKLALDEHIKGQLIFSTHESNLLDNSILRPDEIWFAQKDISGASKFYSLSDFKMHNTLSIENGYLNGRFGGIPFLGNLTDLNWDNHEVSE
jgi:AAA15 family ATPase/GTPase